VAETIVDENKLEDDQTNGVETEKSVEERKSQPED